MLKRRVLATSFVLAISMATDSKAAEVPLTSLLAHTQQFDGKRVSFIAYWDSDGHAMSLRAGPPLTRRESPATLRSHTFP
jgi:hypothetical protein